MTNFKNILIISLIIITIVLLFITAKDCKQKKLQGNLTVKDTVLIERYIDKLKTDTVIKWYERIVKIKAEPEIIYTQKVDTAFIDKTKNLDLFLQVEKSGNNLLITAINQNGEILKEYNYKNVYNDFTATATTNNIIVKSDVWYWNKPFIKVSANTPIENIANKNFKDINYSINLMSGISFKNKIDFDIGLEYINYNKSINAKAELTIRPF